MAIRKRTAELLGERNLEFFRHARNYVSASALSGVISFFSIAVLTRLLSEAEYGIYSIFLSIVSVFSILLELNFRGAVNRHYLERTDDFPSFLKTALVFLAGAAGISVLALTLGRQWLAAFFEVAPAVFVLGVAVAALSIPWNLNWKLLVAQQRSARYAKLSVSRDALVFAVGALWVYVLAQQVGPGTGCMAPDDAAAVPGEAGLICGRHMGMLYGTAAIALGFGAVLAVRLWRVARPGRLERRHLAYALGFGLPLMPHALSGYALGFFDRVIVNQLQGEQSTGLYSFAYNVGMAMNMIVMAMNQAWIPIFVDHRREGRYGRIAELARTYSKYVFALALVMVLFAREIAMVLADERYWDALPLVPVIVFGYVAVFLYTLYANHSFYLRRTGLISVATVIAGAVNIASNYWLIPIFGYAAAAWTTLGSYLLLFALHFVIARFVLRERVSPLGDLLPWFGGAGAVAAGYVVLEAALDSYWLTVFFLKIPLLALLGWWLYRARPRKTDETAPN